MLVVSLARFALARRYWRAVSTDVPNGRWNTAFVVGTALAAAGWAAGIVALYPSGLPMNEVLVVFVIGGVMLGSASLLAARPEAFLTFLLPTGLVTSARVASQGDEEHLIMGFLGPVFTAATIITTWRFHLAIESSLTLQFANQQSHRQSQTAKDDTDALNRDLEFRVRDRTGQTAGSGSTQGRIPGDACPRAPQSARRDPLCARKAEGPCAAGDGGTRA